jgi:hypothetical protein
MIKIIFDFNALGKSYNQIKRYFSKAGSNVVNIDSDNKVRRTNGISYKEVGLTFADSQTVLLRVKGTGDIYQVVLNGKLTPIKNQDDATLAIAEIVQMMNAGRSKFQQKLAKLAIKPPPSIKTAAPKMLQVLTEKRDGLKEAIAEVMAEIEQLRNPVSA